jgi:hypothetical protein
MTFRHASAWLMTLAFAVLFGLPAAAAPLRRAKQRPHASRSSLRQQPRPPLHRRHPRVAPSRHRAVVRRPPLVAVLAAADSGRRPDTALHARVAAPAPVAPAPLRVDRMSSRLPGNTAINASPAPSMLPRRQITPLAFELPIVAGRATLLLDPERRADTLLDRELDAGTSTELSLMGIIEAPDRGLRMAVLKVNGRVVYGRVGEVVAERYRLGAFTERDAEVVDIASDAILEVVSAPPPPPVIAAAAPRRAPTGALHVIAQPEFAAIYVDRMYVGTVADIKDAPASLRLEPGSHHLELQAPQHQPIEIDVRIDPNRTTTYRVALQRQP